MEGRDKMENKRLRSFWLFHLSALLLFGICVGGFILFRVLRNAGIPVVTCPLHDLLHLYCPLCGGTRALLALLRFDFPTAFRLNPAVLLSIPVLLYYYVRALILFFKGGAFSFRLPRAWTFAFLFLFGLFFLVRNVMLVAFGFDPAGDFVHA